MRRLADYHLRECGMKDDANPVDLRLELKHFDPVVAQVPVVVVLQVAVRKRRKLIFCWMEMIFKYNQKEKPLRTNKGSF